MADNEERGLEIFDAGYIEGNRDGRKQYMTYLMNLRKWLAEQGFGKLY